MVQKLIQSYCLVFDSFPTDLKKYKWHYGLKQPIPGLVNLRNPSLSNHCTGGAAQLKQGGEVAEIEYIDIICYDDSEKPVAKYPTNAPDRFATVPNQPLVLVNGAFPSSAGPQSKGAKKESPPKPEGYNGALTDNGSVPDSGSNDGSGQSAGNSNGGNSNTNTSTFGDKKPSGEVDLVHLNGLVLLAVLFSYLL